MGTVLSAVEGRAQGKAKPAYQYESGDIRVSVPTADEPRVKTFGAGSINLAVKYLEDGLLGLAELLRGDKVLELSR